MPNYRWKKCKILRGSFNLGHPLLLKVEQHTDCSSEIKVLLSTINAFVNEHQQKSRTEFEYKRQILILDATDHRLLQTFFNLKPTKSQVSLSSIIFFFF
jgi:hypothetical protein